MNINYLEPIALVDTSYLIFARIHATIAWYKLNQNDTRDKKEINYFKIPLFMEKYNKLCLQRLRHIIDAYKIKSLVFALDCQKKDIWRNEHSMQTYKGTRQFNLEDGMREIFKYTIDSIIAPFAKENNYYILSVDGAEADDINAILTKYIRYKNAKCEIYIISTDNDYNQLLDEYTQKMSITSTTVKHAPNSCLKKILEGDKSDNITECKMVVAGKLLKMTDKNFKKHYPDKTYDNIYGGLLQFLYDNIKQTTSLKHAIKKTIDEKTTEIEKYISPARQFINNQALIDFNCIPKDIVNNILQLIDADHEFHL